MLIDFSKELEQGANAETLAAKWNDAIPLPAFQKLREPSLIAIQSLPTAVAERIVEVVRRTRLWRNEQIDVARELIGHFQDGIDTGIAAEQLIGEFGNPPSTARLIRRAKLRNRRLSWQIFHGASQALAVAFVVLVFIGVWLFVRFQLSHPKIVRDYVGEMDARSIAVAKSNRAWPLYAEAFTKSKWNEIARGTFPATLTNEGVPRPEWAGLMLRGCDVQRSSSGPEYLLQRWPVSKDEVEAHRRRNQDSDANTNVDMDAFWKAMVTDLGRGPHWPALVDYLQMNEPVLRLILQGSTKLRFGFVYRDPDNAVWLASTHESAYESLEKSTHSILSGLLLPQIQQMRSAESVCCGSNSNAPVWPATTNGSSRFSMRTLNIARAQLYHADGFTVSRLVSFAFSDRCWDCHAANPGPKSPDFSSQTSIFAIWPTASPRIDRKSTWNSAAIPTSFCDDLLQRLYTDDGAIRTAT